MKLISRTAIVAVAAIAVAGPSYARSVDRGAGRSDIVRFDISGARMGAQPTPVAMRQLRHRTIAARRSSADAFAMVPAIGSGSAFGPALTGGGSVGYNDNLRNYR